MVGVAMARGVVQRVALDVKAGGTVVNQESVTGEEMVIADLQSGFDI